jgi:hypothetical protein
MRIRQVKPGFWSHRMHRKLSEFEALLALALLNFADDEGRLTVCPWTIKALLLTHREKTAAEIQAAIEALAKVEWLTLYKGVVDGEEVPMAVVTKFADHQVVSKPRPSSLPAPPRGSKKASSDTRFPDASRNVPGMLPERSVHPESSVPSSEDFTQNGAFHSLEVGRDRIGRIGRKDSTDDDSSSEGVGSIVPPDDEVLAFAAAWPGRPAEGVPPVIPPDYVFNWLAWRRSPKGGGFPSDWKRDITFRWSGRFLENLREGVAKKTGAAGQHAKEHAGAVPALRKL